MSIAVTIVSGDVIANIECSSDMEFINFIALCQLELPTLENIPLTSIILTFNGKNIIPSDKNLSAHIDVSGDVINVDKIIDKPSSSAQRIPSSTNQKPNVKDLVARLVQNINVPNTKNRERETSKSIYDVLKEPGRLIALQSKYPDLAKAYEQNPTDYEHFHRAFLVHIANQQKRARLMQDENSEEGQRYIAEQIAQENIDYSHEFAMEHMPEVSILSESCAIRCNIFRLVDTRFQNTAIGVGGQEKFLGRIHSCQVQVENHIFPCPFDVMGNRNVDILFGLNMLKRHHCSIDLKKNVLRFGDGTEAEFLNEEAYRREMEAIELEKIHGNITFNIKIVFKKWKKNKIIY